jgi:hypothetical protein
MYRRRRMLKVCVIAANEINLQFYVLTRDESVSHKDEINSKYAILVPFQAVPCFSRKISKFWFLSPFQVVHDADSQAVHDAENIIVLRDDVHTGHYSFTMGSRYSHIRIRLL